MVRLWRNVDKALWLSAGVLVGWGTSRWAVWARKTLVQWLWPIGPLVVTRPLVTFDIESTGTNVTKDKIVEIAAIKLMPDGSVVVKGPQRLNPGIPMSEEVIAIHGITQADVQDCPRFEEVAQEWFEFLQGCDLHGYNAKKFDVPILRNEFKRSGISNFPPLGVPVVDSFRLFCLQEPRNLGAAVQFYCGQSHDGAAAHTALADAQASLNVLVEQVRRYPSLPRDVPTLAALCAAPSRAQDITSDGKFQWRGDVPILAFGKHAGEPLAVLMSTKRDYLRWMSGQDFSDESLLLVDQALKGFLPTKSGGWEPLVFETQQQQQPQQQQQQQQQQQPPQRQQQFPRPQQERELRQAGDSSNSSSRGRGRGSSSYRRYQGAAAVEASTAAAAAQGWPTSDSESTSQWAEQLGTDSWAVTTEHSSSSAAAESTVETEPGSSIVDSWAEPPALSGPTAATAVEAAALSDVAAAEEESSSSPVKEGSSSPNGGWSIVDPATQDMVPGALDLATHAPQQTLQE